MNQPMPHATRRLHVVPPPAVPTYHRHNPLPAVRPLLLFTLLILVTMLAPLWLAVLVDLVLLDDMRAALRPLKD